jgi:type II secretory pathway pseudopilin PulG
MLPRLRQALASRPRGGEAGYNMVMLIVALTILNIMLAAMMPLMSTEIQREKEEELIFRGWQYAEAIRVFHMRFQRYPNKLEELIEIKPRCIRQLWKDPMAKDGKWGIIFQGQGVPLQVQNPQDPEGRQSPQVNPQDPEGPAGGQNGQKGGQDQGTGGTPKPGDVVAVGPIVGVYSKSAKPSHLVFYGHERYDEWRFTADLLTTGQGTSPYPGGDRPINAPISTRWLGRPMYLVGQQGMPQNGTLPGQTPGGGGTTPPTSGGKKPFGRP